jgi:hypothetical protein
MPSHNDIKTAAYLDPIINYAETHLGCRLKRTGEHRYTTGKNATDSTLIIDAMDLVYASRSAVNDFVLQITQAHKKSSMHWVEE